ncbi:unnamed protein product [Rodentolepis nana]|uniref:FXYD domain-containing ion transport regulator n=1 Tax=Rodentolepis nana TaxID=102285 RepID=A0A0R3T0X3_RODNA|nr:unnamed protein product [Rodentolepis nana]
MVSALTLEEAKQNPQESILYDLTPYNKTKQFGYSALLVFGVLTVFTSTIAIVAKLNGSNPRKRTTSIKPSWRGCGETSSV